MNDVCIVFVHGFEGSSTCDSKFKRMSDALKVKNIDSLRFDFLGCGISDGDFTEVTVENMSNELQRVVEDLKYSKIVLVGHSLAGCVIANYISKYALKKIKKVVYIAPAFNQEELLAYWFVQSKNKGREVNWSEYLKYYSKDECEDYYEKKLYSRTSYFPKKYYQENKGKNYQDCLKLDCLDVLIVHGEKDGVVPLESFDLSIFDNKILVKDGDHDLPRIDMFKEYYKGVVDFILDE